MQVTPERVAAIAARLAEQWPNAVVELDHANAYQLLVATILAAQSTDKLINTVTPALFARYPTPAELARADPAELETMIFSTGFYRMKAKHLLGMAQRIVEKYGGEVPDTMEKLVDLPGVARKTANVVLGSALGKNEGVVVDTHVTRVAQRLGLTRHIDPLKIEEDLMHVVPRDQWSIFAHRLIWHGRRVCHARNPDCEHCVLAPLCPRATLAGDPVARPPTRSGRGAKPAPAGALTSKTPRAAKPSKPSKAAKPKAEANQARIAANTHPSKPSKAAKPKAARERRA